MFNRTQLDETIALAKEFIALAEATKADLKIAAKSRADADKKQAAGGGYAWVQDPFLNRSAARRKSLDLTRSLARLRKP